MEQYRIIERPVTDRLGEGPLWSQREQALYWVDILTPRLNRLDPATGEIRQWDMPEPIGWVIERAGGGFIAGMKSGVHRLSLDPFSLELAVALEPGRPEQRMNDAKADAAGRIWAGTVPMSCDVPTGSFYRIDPDFAFERVDSGYCVANGPAISPDGRWLFHTDSHPGLVYRFALNADGTLGPREIFLRFADDWGSPDGMTFDAEGGLWIAHWGGSRISRFLPDGRLDRSIALPASQITSCAFGGPELDRLYVTSAAEGLSEEHGGKLFEIDPGFRGLAAYPFAG